MAFDPGAFDNNAFDTGGAVVTTLPLIPPVTVLIEVTDENGDWVDITPVVLITDAMFSAQANGVAGQAHLRIKDPGNSGIVTPTFPDVGAKLRLKINGTNEWLGVVIKRQYTYAFEAEDTTHYQRLTRLIVIEGVDLNFLFSRRYVFDQEHPVREIPEYAQGTSDVDVISDILENYVDLSGYGIDLSSGIVEVGTPGQFEQFKIARIGDSLGTVFTRITQNLGSIFYIDPGPVLRYTDDETISAPHPLSDRPTGSQVGYRQGNVRSDGTDLCNDMFVWGAGVGSPDMVFQRHENSDSISKRGRFQAAELHSDMYKKTTAEIRARTYVEGSPQNHRGHKNEKDYIACTIFRQGYRVGMVVDFRSQAHGYQDNVPIRSSVITFPTPTNARWDLTLSHEIDPGIVFADWPPNSGPGTPKHLPWGEDIVCSRGSLFDTFTRTVSRSPMTADTYRLWDEWGEWRVVSAGPTYAHGQYVDHDAPVDPYGRWRDIYSNDIVEDVPGTGNPLGFPHDPPPDIEYIAHALFQNREYNTTSDGGSWGTAESGETWEVYQPNTHRPVSFAVLDGEGIYDVGPYDGTGSSQEAGIRIGLGTPVYPIELYFENRFEADHLPGDPGTTGEMDWTFGVGGGASDTLRLVRQTDFDQEFYLDPAGSAALQVLSTGLISLIEPFAIRVLITEDTIYGKVWQLSSEEPFGWQGSIGRSGSVANSFMVRAASSTTDVLYHMDNLTLVGFSGDCSFQTTYPYVEGTLKASVDGENVFVIESGDGRHFEIPSWDGGQIAVSYVRSDAFQNGASDPDVVDDPHPGEPTHDPGGGGAGEWRWPCTGYLTQGYGCTGFPLEPPRGSCAHFHDGIDIANSSGTVLRSPMSGEVTLVGWNPWDSTDPAFIVVVESGDYQISLGHLLPIYKVSIGQHVERGQLLGFMGSTGNSTGPHTHFEARYRGDTFDPRVKLEGLP